MNKALWALSEIKRRQALRTEPFRELLDKWQFSGDGIFGKLSTHLLPTMTVILLVITPLWLGACWFWWLPQSWGERDEIREGCNTTSLTDLIEMWLFSLNKCSLDYCKLLVDFQNSEKVHSDNLCQGSCCFYARAGFWRFWFCHSRR